MGIFDARDLSRPARGLQGAAHAARLSAHVGFPCPPVCPVHRYGRRIPAHIPRSTPSLLPFLSCFHLSVPCPNVHGTVLVPLPRVPLGSHRVRREAPASVWAKRVWNVAIASRRSGMASSRFALREEWTGHERAVSMVKFSPDGTRLASASADRTLRVWDWERLAKEDGGVQKGDDGTKEPEMVLKGHTMGVSSVAWSTNSRYLCSASDDRTLRLWDTKGEGKCVKVLKGHTHFVFCCAFNAQSNLLASGSFDETVKLWEVKTGKLLKDLPAHSDPITAVDFSSDGKQVVSSSFDGLCRVWDAETGHCIRTIVHAGNPPVSFAKFSPNGKYVLAATLDNSIRLWSVDTGTCLKVYQGHTNERYCLVSAFCTSSKTGQWVISGSEDHGIYIWDLQKKHLAQKIEGRPDKSTPGTGHCSPVLCVDCHPTKSVFASCSHESDKAIKLWEEM